MRLAHKYLLSNRLEAKVLRRDVDHTPAQFDEAMGYAKCARSLTSRDAFFAQFAGQWIDELHGVLILLLRPHRRVLGLGSGFGEHELPFALKGYDVTASDIVFEPLLTTHYLFPELKVRNINAFESMPLETWDDVLITGLDFYFCDSQTQDLFQRVADLLRNSEVEQQRLIFVLRYRDNFATRLIDNALRGRAWLLNLHARLSRGDSLWVQKAHGFRRSERDIIRLAQRVGFQPRAIAYAGFGVELTRLAFLTKLDRALGRVITRADRHLHWFNNCSVIEFVLNDGSNARGL